MGVACMGNPADTLGPWAARDLVHVIIDTPGGSRNKYKFDDASGLFKLSRVLPAGLHFPCDFGYIPGTQGEDGDALDVAVLNDAASFVGCLMNVRLIGLIRASQTEKGRNIQNDRMLGVPVTPVNRPIERDINQIGQERLKAIE